MDSVEAAVRIRVELGRAWLSFPKRSTPRPTRLFHYTTQKGLLGIVESNVLWATNVLYLNDSTEIAYGLSLARKYLRALADKSPTGVVSAFLDCGDHLLDLPVLLPDRQFYAVCLCEKPDLLSQWRAYADRGGGYAIGFDTEDLTQAVVKKNLSLFPVEYGPDPSLQLSDRDAPGHNSDLLAHDAAAPSLESLISSIQIASSSSSSNCFWYRSA